MRKQSAWFGRSARIAVLVCVLDVGPPLAAEQPTLRHSIRTETTWVDAVALSPDGKTLATANENESAPLIRLWNLKLLRQTENLAGHTGKNVYALAFSPDGKSLASGGGDGTVRLWEVATGKNRLTAQANDGAIRAVAFIPDGKALVCGGAKGHVALWGFATGQLPATLGKHDTMVHCLEVSPDGTVVASGDAGHNIKLWDLTTGQEQATLRGHTNIVACLAFSPDGKVLASGGFDQTLRLWEVATGKLRAVFPPQKDPEFILCVAFSRDGSRMATGGSRGHIRLWNAATGKETGTATDPTWAVKGLAFSPDGSTLVSATWGFVRIWDLPLAGAPER